MPKLFAQFLETADAKGLDVECLDKLAYTPPFMSFNGWGRWGGGAGNRGVGTGGGKGPGSQGPVQPCSCPIRPTPQPPVPRSQPPGQSMITAEHPPKTFPGKGKGK